LVSTSNNNAYNTAVFYTIQSHTMCSLERGHMFQRYTLPASWRLRVQFGFAGKMRVMAQT